MIDGSYYEEYYLADETEWADASWYDGGTDDWSGSWSENEPENLYTGTSSASNYTPYPSRTDEEPPGRELSSNSAAGAPANNSSMPVRTVANEPPGLSPGEPKYTHRYQVLTIMKDYETK